MSHDIMTRLLVGCWSFASKTCHNNRLSTGFSADEGHE
jgi:hypothetical protein